MPSHGNGPTAAPQGIALLGRDHCEYGRYELARLPTGTTCAISVGSDSRSPSLAFKGNPSIPNEDALLAVEAAGKEVLAVADGHHGHEGSHTLISRLRERLTVVPETVEDLAGVLEALASGEGAGNLLAAGSTFLVAVYDRGRGEGFGLSFGDSSFTIVGRNATPSALNSRNSFYLQPLREARVAVEDGDRFSFRAEPGQLLLLFTDGVDTCHYGRPRTSVSEQHLARLFLRVGAEPEQYARRLMELALSGVDDHPGGQDNVALIVAPAG